jgi:hypothetical protein
VIQHNEQMQRWIADTTADIMIHLSGDIKQLASNFQSGVTASSDQSGEETQLK